MPKTRGRAVKKASQPRLTFLPRLGYEVANPKTVVFRPGSADNSILKLKVDKNSPTCVKQAELESLARVCPRSIDPNTLSRQLVYYRFERLDKTGVHKRDVELQPGLTVSVTYVEYTHVPHETEMHSVWSNARGYPHKDHRRRTNHGLGNGSGAYTEAYPVRRKRKLEECLQEEHTVDELLQNDDVVNDIIKQFASDYVDDDDVDEDHDDEDILRMVDLNVDWTTMEALALLM